MAGAGHSDPGDAAPAAQAQLRELRQRIDAVDDEIVALLNRRANLALEVGRAKAKAALRAYVPERERQVVDRLLAESSGPLSEQALRLIYKEIISASLALESPLQVAFLGPEATFTHEATKRHFGLSACLKSCRTIPDVFQEVERGRCEYGVVPIENSTEGVVSHTLDMFVGSDVSICAEVLLEVSYHLLTRSGESQGLTKVYSHSQALEQCRGWIERHLPQVSCVDVASTARAAQLAAEDAGAAAIGTDLAASMYGLRVAASTLEDMGGNLTRFLVLGHDRPPISGVDRTSIVFSLKDSPGILAEVLRGFAAAGINMSRIESRPSRRRAWEYLFFIDVDGHRDEPKVAAAIEHLATQTTLMKVLGSYAQGKLAGRAPPRRVLAED